ncbi:unnamed protein product, partial [Ectocarpus sp. 12 AP-2014]
EARDVKGRIVYINHTTRTTQWSKPKFSSKKGVATPEPVASGPSKSASGRANGGAAAGAAGGGSRAAGPAAGTPTRLREASATNSVPGSNLPASAGVASRALTTVSSPLPAGWESKIIDGRVVYIDHANQRTSFERPRGQTGGLPQQPRPLSARRQMGIGVGGELVPHSNGAENLGSSRGSHRSGHLMDPIYASNASSAVGDSPLPPGWGRSVTPNGELYYVNHVSKTTTWSRPQWTTGSDGDEESVHGDGTRNPESLASIKSGKSTRSRRGEMLGKFAESAEPPLPPGWEERMSAEGKVFYMNHNDKTTHWTRPDPPPVQPNDSPDDDVPPVETEDVEMASRSISPAIETPPPDHPSNGDTAATASSSLTLDSPARQGGVAAAAATAAATAAAAVAAAAAAAADDDDGVLTSVKEPLPKATGRTADVGAASATVVLEEVADSSPGRGGFGGGVDTNPRRAPSATVVAAVGAAADEVEEASRLVDAPSPTAAAAAARKDESEASSSGKAAEPIEDDDDDAAREREGGGGAGAVSSIMKSGLFGDVVRPGGGSSGDNSSKTAAPSRSGSSVVPLYASKAGGVAAAAAAAAEKPKPELEEPEVDSLPEG